MRSSSRSPRPNGSIHSAGLVSKSGIFVCSSDNAECSVCANKSTTVWERPNFFESSAISKSLNHCLGSSELSSGEIDIYDFYSCFPIVPKLACQHIGLSITKPQKPITVLGGLTSFGGAGNNYSMHVWLPRLGIGRPMLTATGNHRNGSSAAQGLWSERPDPSKRGLPVIPACYLSLRPASEELDTLP